MAQTTSVTLSSNNPVPGWNPIPPPGFLHPFNRAVNQLHGGQGLKDGEIRLLELLLSYDLADPRFGGRQKGFVWPSRTILCQQLNITDRSLRYRLAGLKRAGVIRDMTREELRRFQEMGYAIPDAGRGGLGWKIHYDQFPAFPLAEQPPDRPDRKPLSDQTGKIFPPPSEESKNQESSNKNHQNNVSATSEKDGDGILPNPPDSGEPPAKKEVISGSVGTEQRDLQQTLEEWQVSPPQARRIAQQIDPSLIRQAVQLLQRNQALAETHRVIHHPPGWLVYTLTSLSPPALEEWQDRIAAAEEKVLAKRADPNWRTLLHQALDRQNNYLDPRTHLPDLLEQFPPSARDSAIAGILMARQANGCKDYDSWLESVRQARTLLQRRREAHREAEETIAGNRSPEEPPPVREEHREAAALYPLDETVDPEEAAQIRELIDQSLAQAEAAQAAGDIWVKIEMPPPPDPHIHTLEVGTKDRPGTSASIPCGVKRIIKRYRPPQVPPEEEMNIYDPERTMPAEETPEEGADQEEMICSEELSVGDEKPGEVGPGGSPSEGAVPPEGREAPLGAEQVQEEPLGGEDLSNTTEVALEAEEAALWAPPGDEAMEPGSSDPGKGGEAGEREPETASHASAPDFPLTLHEATCQQLWRRVQAHLEEEQQGSPLLDQVIPQGDGHTLVLRAPSRAIGWALENRRGRIQTLLQRFTGQALGVEIRAGP